MKFFTVSTDEILLKRRNSHCGVHLHLNHLNISGTTAQVRAAIRRLQQEGEVSARYEERSKRDRRDDKRQREGERKKEREREGKKEEWRGFNSHMGRVSFSLSLCLSVFLSLCLSLSICLSLSMAALHPPFSLSPLPLPLVQVERCSPPSRHPQSPRRPPHAP